MNVTGNYKFIGIRSSDGALYANEIVVTYGTPETASNVSNFIMYEDTNNQCTTKLSQAITKLNNMSTSEKTTFNTSNDYVILTARTRLEAWARNQGKTLTYSDTDGTFSASTKVVNSLIASNVNNNITPIIIVVSLIAISSVGGYFFLRHKKER